MLRFASCASRAALLLALALLPTPARAQAPSWERAIADAERAVQQGRYAEAERLLAGAVKEAEAFGPEDPRLARALTAQATFYRILGRIEEAEPLLARAVDILDKAPRREPAELAGVLNDLGFLRQQQGRLADANALYHRTLGVAEKGLPPEHPQIATVLSNLATLYQAQGRYAEAEPLYRGALRISEKALGPDHPAVARALGYLGSLYQIQGRYAEAEPLYRRAVAITEKALGPEHPELATPLGSLASLYKAQGPTSWPSSIAFRGATRRPSRSTAARSSSGTGRSGPTIRTWR